MATSELVRRGLSLVAALSLAASPTTGAASVVLAGDIGQVALGAGYDPAAQRMRDVCVTGEQARLGGNVAWVTSYHASDIETMLHNVDRYGSGGVDVGIIGVSRSVEYFARIARDTQREAVVFEYQVQLGSLVLRPNAALNQYGRDITAMNDAYARRLRCGTEFVRQIDVGYRLYIGLSVTSRSRSVHERLKKKLSVSALFGLVRKSKESVKELQEAAKDVMIEVSAFQEGGHQDRLQRLLQDRSTCTGDRVEACADLLGRLLDYASTDALGFRAQMAGIDGYDPGDLTGPAVLRYVTSTYENAGIEDMRTAEAPAGELQAMREATSRLDGVLVRLSSDEQKADALLASGAVSSERREGLLRLRQGLTRLGASARATRAACESGESAAWCCERAAEHVRADGELDRAPLDQE
ncbi:hypothetical protein WMF28_18965 [Sorangium sp. So ce590]|uniref:hypothetical protein n=1 Tax=Sorangium sp. So ce590 TaxID=3133317 RepID=UPI003F5EC867